jgi:hypothetical protein
MKRTIVKIPIGHAQPGDQVFEKRQGRFIEMGRVQSTRKNNELRSITLTLWGGGSFTQNWAGHIFVRRAA